MHGAGFTGSGEDHLASVVTVEATREGRSACCPRAPRSARARTRSSRRSPPTRSASTSTTIEIVQPDTRVVPEQRADRRVAHLHGRRQAGRDGGARHLRRTLVGAGCSARLHAARRSARRAATTSRDSAPLRASASTSRRRGLTWDDEKYQGDAYGTYAWAVYVAEVTVDPIDVRESRRRLRRRAGGRQGDQPGAGAGQIEGGVAQAIGWALYENVVWRDGRMANAQMTNYIMPTSMDLPPIRVFFEELPYAHGPGGAKGIGELPMDGAGAGDRQRGRARDRRRRRSAFR